jgi:hypothetical protein
METLRDYGGSFFGRDAALVDLIERANETGVTVITGRPLIGKSWLITEVSRRLANSDFLVGYTDVKSESADLLLRTVSDLYERWLANSSYLEQARIIYERHKDEFITTAGLAVGTIVKELKIVPGAGLVKKVFETLATAQADLASGGIELKRLGYDQALELITIVSKLAKRPILLSVDGLDSLRAWQVELGTLNDIVKRFRDWPRLHIFFGIRTDTDVYSAAKQLFRLLPEVKFYEVPLLDFDASKPNQSSMQQLRGEIHALSGLGDDEIINLVGGFPGVVDFWRRAQPRTPGRIAELAADAQHYRYSEFDTLLPSLSGDELTLALRLSLLRPLTLVDWRALGGALLTGELSDGIRAELYRKRVLEDEDAVSYGHETRHRAAQQWFTRPESPYKQHVKREVETLILALAKRLEGIEPEFLPFTAALISLLPVLPPPGPGDNSLFVIVAAASWLVPEYDATPSIYLLLQSAIATVQQYRESELPLAFALGNAIGRLRTKDRSGLIRLKAFELLERICKNSARLEVNQELARGISEILWPSPIAQIIDRPGLLDQLRQLGKRFPDSDPIRLYQAIGLANTMQGADLEKQEGVVSEIRSLHEKSPPHSAIHGVLALALGNLIEALLPTPEAGRRNELMSELRQLQVRFSTTPDVAEHLAIRLTYAIVDHKEPTNPEFIARTLEELRGLAQALPNHQPLKNYYVTALAYILRKSDLPESYLSEIRNELETKTQPTQP